MSLAPWIGHRSLQHLLDQNDAPALRFRDKAAWSTRPDLYFLKMFVAAFTLLEKSRAGEATGVQVMLPIGGASLASVPFRIGGSKIRARIEGPTLAF